MPYEPTDAELTGYIRRRLAEVGDWAEESDLVAESIAHYRDLWLMLFSVDCAFDPIGEKAK